MTGTSTKRSDALTEPRMGPLFESMPLEQRTIVNLITRAARGGERVFLEAAGGQLSFGQLETVAGQVAAGLAAHGVGKGDRVALLTSNRVEWIMAYLGSAWRGAVLVPLAPALRGRLLLGRLEHAQPRLVIAESGPLEEIVNAIDGLTELRALVAVDPDPPDSGGKAVVESWDAFIGRPLVGAAELSYDDVAMISYTSGTTGPSKGVVVTHHHVYCSTVPITDNLQFTPDDVLWTCLPLHHAGAHHHVFLPALISGARAVIRSRFSASDFWYDIRSCEASYAQVIGMMANVLLEQDPDEKDGEHSLRVMTSFPAPNDLAAFAERFGIRLTTQIWGMTEVYPNPPRTDVPPKAPSCVGRPTPLFEVRIVDEGGQLVPQDGATVGEVIVRARLPSAMIREYYLNPDTTRERFRDGWFCTGDLMSWDEEGFFFFVGRSKDMIRRRGENVSAFELETEAMRVGGVEHAAAFGVPSNLGDEDIKLDVIVAPDADLTEAQVVRALRSVLPRYMLPRYVQFRPQFPLTPAGKIEKYKLAAEGVDGAADVLGPGTKTKP